MCLLKGRMLLSRMSVKSLETIISWHLSEKKKRPASKYLLFYILHVWWKTNYDIKHNHGYIWLLLLHCCKFTYSSGPNKHSMQSLLAGWSALCSAVVKLAVESQFQRFTDHLPQKELYTLSFTSCHYLVPTKQSDLGGPARQSWEQEIFNLRFMNPDGKKVLSLLSPFLISSSYKQGQGSEEQLSRSHLSRNHGSFLVILQLFQTPWNIICVHCYAAVMTSAR